MELPIKPGTGKKLGKRWGQGAWNGWKRTVVSWKTCPALAEARVRIGGFRRCIGLMWGKRAGVRYDTFPLHRFGEVTRRAEMERGYGDDR